MENSLNSLAGNAASDMDFENGRLKVKGDFLLQELNQKIKRCSGLIFRSCRQGET